MKSHRLLVKAFDRRIKSQTRARFKDPLPSGGATEIVPAYEKADSENGILNNTDYFLRTHAMTGRYAVVLLSRPSFFGRVSATK